MDLPSVPSREITLEEIESYRRDGVACLPGVFDRGWIELLRGAVEQAMAAPGPFAEEYTPDGASGRFFGDLDVWRRVPDVERFVRWSPAAEIIGRIMESDKVNFFYDQLLVKEPGTADRTPWHQDQPYWAVNGRQVASIWLPLDPVDREASIQYVKGSHHWPAYNPHHFVDDTPYEGTGLPELPDIDADPDGHEIVSWDMGPGDCLVFQAMIVHGSQGNLSSARRRRALATRWTGDDARFARRGGEVAIPTTDPGLADGAPMDCDLFPVVWRREGGLTAR